MNPLPAAPPVASYTRRVYRNELRFAREYPDLSAAARKRIGETRHDAAEFHFVAATISNATGERFCYVTVEKESADRVVWVKAWRTDAGPATAVVLDQENYTPVACW